MHFSKITSQQEQGEAGPRLACRKQTGFAVSNEAALNKQKQFDCTDVEKRSSKP